MGQHDDLEVARVHDVRQCEVDQPVDPRERDRGLGPIGRERHQPLPLTAGQDDREHPRSLDCHVGTVTTIPPQVSTRLPG